MASLFEIGKTGVQAYRQALSVTGQNSWLDKLEHPLQQLRDVHRVQASLLRPSAHGPGHTPLHDMRGAIRPQGMPHLQQKLRETKIPRLTMDRGVEDEGVAQLVLTLHRVPHLHQL